MGSGEVVRLLRHLVPRKDEGVFKEIDSEDPYKLNKLSIRLLAVLKSNAQCSGNMVSARKVIKPGGRLP